MVASGGRCVLSFFLGVLLACLAMGFCLIGLLGNGFLFAQYVFDETAKRTGKLLAGSSNIHNRLHQHKTIKENHTF